MADDDDENFGGMYEEGHWVWDDSLGALVFISDAPPKEVEAIQILTKAPTGAIEFRDDVDLIEQDVKDIAIYTAPVNILSPMLINILHLPTTERFIRALILCCAYYLQTEEEMTRRMLEMETKVRTPYCELLEHEFRDNLSDLRLLVAKEYCTMLIGGGDTRKFHHMGPAKKRRSLTDKDARLFETMVRVCVQIVWLALGRKSFNQIEIEVNRIFKSETFNCVEHNLKTGYIAKMAREQREVLLGYCLRHDKKLCTRSPLLNEVFCHREIDYSMMGLGVIKPPLLTARLNFMLVALAAPEDQLGSEGVSLGIIGSPRNVFDTMLRPIPGLNTEGKSKGSMSSTSQYSASKSSASMTKAKSGSTTNKLYPDVVLPSKESAIFFPATFPSESVKPLPCSETQRRRWQQRLHRLLHPNRVSMPG